MGLGFHVPKPTKSTCSRRSPDSVTKCQRSKEGAAVTVKAPGGLWRRR